MSFSPCQTFGSTPGPAPSKRTVPWLAGSDYSDGMGLTVDLPASEEPRSYKQPEPHLQVTPSAQYLLLFSWRLNQLAFPETSGKAPGPAGGTSLPDLGCQDTREGEVKSREQRQEAGFPEAEGRGQGGVRARKPLQPSPSLSQASLWGRRAPESR